MLCSIVAALTMTMSAAAQTTDAASQEITTAEDAWRQARIDGDVGFLERFYAKEGRIQGIDGRLQSRAADIDIFRTGKIKPMFIDHRPLDITVYGNTAVVTGVDHLGGTAFRR
jgi:ketosteroid isomerase-like protein